LYFSPLLPLLPLLSLLPPSRSCLALTSLTSRSCSLSLPYLTFLTLIYARFRRRDFVARAGEVLLQPRGRFHNARPQACIHIALSYTNCFSYAGNAHCS
jgi:hypothetical protein